MIRPLTLLSAVILLVSSALPSGFASAQSRPRADFEALPFNPRRTVVYRTPTRLTIDGKLDEAAWKAVEPSTAFVDIEGELPVPLRTRMRMLWDEERFYVAAELEEPHVWATLKERDSVIFRDNDFELFIDPDGDTHAYYELEVNAFGTPWDLLLVQPYRDGGPAVHAWDIAGLEVGVDVRGTLNEPGDKDEGWTVEVAMPWRILREAASEHRTPRAGEQWRVNFSRVQWDTTVQNGAYVKKVNETTGRPLPEHNWVWSPQGAINMHMPERWGFVQFSDLTAGAGVTPFVDDPNERLKWALRRLYYRQQRYRASNGRYAADIAALDAPSITVEGLDFKPFLQTTGSLYELTAQGFGGARVHLRQDGRTFVSEAPPQKPPRNLPDEAPLR